MEKNSRKLLAELNKENTHVPFSIINYFILVGNLALQSNYRRAHKQSTYIFNGGDKHTIFCTDSYLIIQCRMN